MEGSKDPIHITSIIITFIIFLTGAALSYWLYTKIIQSPSAASDKTVSVPQIDTKKLEAVKAPQTPTLPSPKDGYGRENPFVSYK